MEPILSSIPLTAGTDVTIGYKGGMNTTWEPVTELFWEIGMCPVNVHWYLGAEHCSEGEYDETFADNGPEHKHLNRHLSGDARQGFRCKNYDASNIKFTTE
eukprot:scaffold18934_cov50-Cyclotella_meneghiniana.AAC.4